MDIGIAKSPTHSMLLRQSSLWSPRRTTILQATFRTSGGQSVVPGHVAGREQHAAFDVSKGGLVVWSYWQLPLAATLVDL